MSDEPRRPEPTDHLVTSRHHIGDGDERLDYTVVCGRTVLREESIDDGEYAGAKPRAEIFHISYVLDQPERAGAGGGSGDAADAGGDPRAERPVTFAFNGGPGSSSVWLHLGLLGPRRVVMGDAGALTGPPWGLTDNLQTLLQVSDLVFVDPVTTGFSRAAEGHQADDYHGFKRDLEAMASFIRTWTSRNGRWLSPKFLAGESYGTTRAAGLAALLAEDSGLYLNGLMLISSVLDMGSVHFSEGNDQPYSLYLPTYTAAAHYHGLIGGELTERIAEAEEFATTRLPYALARGHRLPAEERSEIVARYAELTGLDPGYVDRADLRITLFEFVSELLRERGQQIGRLDLRFTGWPELGNADHSYDDPTIPAIMGPYSAAFNDYIRTDLGYRSDLVYNVLTPKVHPWSYADFEGTSVQVTKPLSEAMRSNPHLRVHVACGYYDGATPHLAAEHVFAHLHVPRSELSRIEWAYYPAGHMMYVHEPSRLAQSADLIAFVRSASGR